MTVEVLAHRGRELAQPPRFVALTRALQHLGVAVELLEQQRDRPAAHHPVAHLRVGRLQRVVPVAFAVADQVRIRDEPLADRGEQLVDMRRDRILARRRLGIILPPPRNRLVEEREIVRGLDVVAERLERPDDHVAVAVPVPDRAIGLEHEPLRPVATRLVLLREDDPQDLLDRLVVLERQQELDRALACVARAPRGAPVLLQAMRHGEVHHGVVREPREQRIERRNVGSATGDPQAARDVRPVSCGRRQHGRILDATRVLRREALGRFGIGH